MRPLCTFNAITHLSAYLALASLSLQHLVLSAVLCTYAWCAYSFRHMDCCKLPPMDCKLQGGGAVSASLVHALSSGPGTIAGTQNIFVLNKCPH